MSRARSFRQIITGFALIRVAIGTCLLLVGGLLVGVTPAIAVPTPAERVALGSAAGFSVLAGPSVTNTGAGTVLALDLGVTGTLTGFPPGIVTGEIHIDDDAVEAAHGDRQAAYDAAAAQTGGTAFAGDQMGKTFTPGLYTAGAAVTNTGTMTLDAAGDPNAVFVFQVGAALSGAAGSKVVLKNGALANNVYWQVVGAVALGADAAFVGTVLGAGVISFGAGASLKGRALTSSTMALADSPVTQPIDDLTPPVIAIDGGPTRSTNDTTPPISGTTDEPGRPLVTVTTGPQTLTTRAVDGAWTLSANALTAGTHQLVASVTDPSQNIGTATQDLTVDTTTPGVAITGGATSATDDITPTISGTTDEAGTPTVTVTVAGQTLSTTASAGTWTVDAGALTETAHGVAASVTDPAGNTGTGRQVLTVDITVPVLTIRNGETDSTSDTSPWIYGTTAERAGTIVDVSVGGQARTAIVEPGGTWGVSAESLAPGTYEVVASITDAAGNVGSARQTLTIGEGAPPVGPRIIVPITPPTAPVSQPAPAATYRPDAEIRLGTRAFVGRSSYSVARQRVTSTLKGSRAKTVTYQVRVTNRGNVADRLTIRGTSKSKQFTVKYLQGRKNVTSAVLKGTYRTATLQTGQSVTLTVRVTKVARAKKGSKRTFSIRAASAQDRRTFDTVAAVVKVAR